MKQSVFFVLVFLSLPATGGERPPSRGLFGKLLACNVVLFTASVAGLGVAAVENYLQSGDEVEVKITSQQQYLLQKNVSLYRSKEELRRDIESLYPYLFQLMQAKKETLFTRATAAVPHTPAVSSGELLMGRMVRPDEWTENFRPVVQRWGARASEYGVVLPSPVDFENADKTFGAPSSSIEVGGIAAHYAKSYPQTSNPEFEAFLVGFLTDAIWENPEQKHEHLGSNLYFAAPGASYGETRPGPREARINDIKQRAETEWWNARHQFAQWLQ